MPGEPPAYNWNEKWPASIATDTGPTSDTTSFRADSLPLFTPTHPLTVATALVLSNAQGCCCNTIMIWSHFALNHLISLNPKYQLEKKIFSPQKMKKNVPYLMITFVITFTLQMFQHTETISAIIIITEKLDIRYSCYSLNKSSIK